jgi:RHS repeat-associated protein
VNNIGQRTGVVTTGSAFPAQPANWTWGYDALGQVTSADSPTNTSDRAYEYDQIGNRKKSADGALVTTGAATIYEPNPLNQYSSIENQQSSIVNPVYDADGNATSYPLPVAPTANATLTYDGENRLISVATGTTTVSYVYDSQSRRVARTEGANTTVYLYDTWNCLAEYTLHISSFDLQTSHTWGLDLSGTLQGAGGVGGLLAVTKHQAQGTTHYFPTCDGNGNISEYLDSTGAIVAHYEYDPFGCTTVATGPSSADFEYRFSTKPVDPATGLYYYGYRWFDPETGRWINRDPIEERGGLNLYGFVGNSSLFNFDVVGLQGFPGVPPNLNTNGQVTDWALGNYKPHHPPMPPPAKFDDSWPEECPGGQMEVLVYDNFPLDIVIPALFGENSTNPFGKLALSCCCERLVGIALQINDDKDRNIMQNQLGIQRNAMFGMLALRNGGVHVRIGPDIITHKGIIFAGVLGRFSDLKIDANGNLLSSDGTLRPDLPFVDEDEKFRATLRDKLAEHKEELKKIVAAYPSVLRKIDEFTDACKNRGLKK